MKQPIQKFERKTISLKTHQRIAIEKLAKKTARSFSGYIQWLIEKELQK